MSNPDSKALLKESNLFRVISEAELKKLGVTGLLLEELKQDRFQNRKEDGYLGALVLNYLARTGHWNSDQAANNFVLAIPFSECIGYDLTDLLTVKDNERSLVVQKKINKVEDLYIGIADLHFFTDSGQGENLTQLATRYYQTKNPTIKDRVLAIAKETVLYIALKAKSNLPQHVNEEELFTAGMRGLWKALESFDPCYGVSFETHLGPRVIGSIQDALREDDFLSRVDRTRLTAMEEFRDKYFIENYIQPTKEDYKAHWLELGFPEDNFNDFYYCVFLRGNPLSLDQSLSDDEDDSEEHTKKEDTKNERAATPDSILMNHELKQLIEQDLKAVPPKFHSMFLTYLFERKSMKETGELFDLSESRVSQLCTQYLRSPHFFKRTRKYLGITDVIYLKL